MDSAVDLIPTAPAAALAELSALLGERFTTAASIRDQHGREESYHRGPPPDGVAFVHSTEEVAAVVRICAAHRLPLIPFGAGTSLEGQLTVLRGGISLDMTGMNQVLRVGAEDLDVTVQAGVTRKQLNAYLKDTGLFFPIDPGADATIGGMAATRASGTNAVRYGTMRENVLNLTVVLADGQAIQTAKRARKSAAGYDLTRLFVGSEGTLGVITEVTLKLHGIPEAISAAVCPFPDIGSAVRTVIETIQSGIPVARIELLDEVQMAAVIAWSKLDYPAVPTLFFEFHGTTAGVVEQAERVRDLAAENGAGEFVWATKPEDRAKLWQARHDSYYAALALRPGAKGWATDVCVPISRLADCILETKQDLAASFIQAPLVGHVGDGNFHLVFLVDPENPAEMAEAERLNRRMVERALAMDGTCTGEHGIGCGKMDFLEVEHGRGISLMRAIKHSFDPHGIFNPGKIFGPGDIFSV